MRALYTRVGLFFGWMFKNRPRAIALFLIGIVLDLFSAIINFAFFSPFNVLVGTTNFVGAVLLAVLLGDYLVRREK